MGFSIKTVFNIFIVFFLFQLSCNLFIEAAPSFKNYVEYSQHNTEFIKYMTVRVNGVFSGEQESITLLDNLRNSITKQDLLDGNILSSFWGIVQIIFSVIQFIIALAVQLLFLPGVIVDLLFYGLALGSIPTIFSIIISIVANGYMLYMVINYYQNK